MADLLFFQDLFTDSTKMPKKSAAGAAIMADDYGKASPR